MQFTLTCKQLVHLVLVLVVFRQAELLVDFLVFLQGIHDVLHALFDDLPHGLRVVQLRFLRQVAYRVAGREHHVALVALVQPCDDFQQGGLSGAVQTDDTNLGSIEETEVDVLKNLFLSLLDGLAYTNH